MARYFKYKTAADLLAENARLGLDLRLSDDLAPLNESAAVAGRTVGNRWCVHPMEGCDGDLAGRPGELTVRRYVRFGGGGAKLVWGEACAVVEEARANPRQLWLADHTAADFARLVEGCRKAHRDGNGTDSDFLFGLQLTHSGRYSHRRPLPAAILTDDDLKRLPDQYAAAAKLTAAAGFDFADVKQCHGYLLNELLSARDRPGPFGGSIENRTRLARDIFAAVRAAAPGLILATRLNVFDGGPPGGWGMAADGSPDLTEPLRWVAEMRTLGVALVNVTAGNPYAWPHVGRPFEVPPPDGAEPPEHPLVGVDRHFKMTAAVQAAFPDLPVVGTGYSYLQDFLPAAAAANVRDGRTTFAGVGRASLSQPDWVRQLRDHGALDRKRVCRTFSYCTALMRTKTHPLGQFPAGCPPFDKEGYGEAWREVQALRTRRS